MSGYTGSLLAQSSPKSLRALGSHGRAAWRSHASIQSLIRQSIRDPVRAERVAAFFASPVLEPDGEVMSWYAAVRGVARPLSVLGVDERRRAEGEVSEISRELSALAVSIRSRSSGGGALAEVIGQALRRPETGDSLFLVGDQPVSVWWGFQDQPARLDSTAPATLPPLPQWPRKTDEPGEHLEPSAATSRASAFPAPAAALSSGVWRWLQWVLLAIALLALMLLALRGCQNVPGLLAANPPAPALDPPAADQAAQRPQDGPFAPVDPAIGSGQTGPAVGDGPKPSPAELAPSDRTVRLSEGERVQLAPVTSGAVMTVTLEWSTAVDLDLWAIFRRPDGSQGEVFFSSKVDNGIELDNDAGTDMRSGRHREIITVSDFSAFSELLFVANIFDSDLLKNLIKPSRSFSEFDGKVTVRTSAREEVFVALTANDKASWFAIAKLVNVGGKPEVKNVNRVSRFKPRVEDF